MQTSVKPKTNIVYRRPGSSAHTCVKMAVFEQPHAGKLGGKRFRVTLTETTNELVMYKQG